MINWDVWNIQHSVMGTGDVKLLDIKAEYHLKLNPGHEIKSLRRVIPFGPEKNVNKILEEFKKELGQIHENY